MTSQEVFDHALALPEGERARLALDLIRSLDPPGEEVNGEEWHQVWGGEIARRSDKLARGEVQMIDWRESLARARRRLADQSQ